MRGCEEGYLSATGLRLAVLVRDRKGENDEAGNGEAGEHQPGGDLFDEGSQMLVRDCGASVSTRVC